MICSAKFTKSRTFLACKNSRMLNTSLLSSMPILFIFYFYRFIIMVFDCNGVVEIVNYFLDKALMEINLIVYVVLIFVYRLWLWRISLRLLSLSFGIFLSRYFPIHWLNLFVVCILGKCFKVFLLLF